MIDQKYKYASNDFDGAKGLIFVEGTDKVIMIRRGSTAPQAPNQVDPPGGRQRVASRHGLDLLAKFQKRYV